MHASKILKRTIDDALMIKGQHSIKRTKLTVTFRDPVLKMSAYKLSKPLFPNIEIENDSLSCFYFSYEEAAIAKSKIKGIFNQFNRQLYDINFVPNWLTQVETSYNYSATSIVLSDEHGHHLDTSSDTEPSYGSDELSVRYGRSLKYSDEMFVDDLYVYLEANTLGLRSNDITKQCLVDLFKDVRRIVKGVSFLSYVDHRVLLNHMYCKAEALIKAGDDFDTISEELRIAADVKNKFRQDTDLSNFPKFLKLLTELLVGKLGGLTPRPKTHKIVPFNGFDLSSVIEGNIDMQMDPFRIRSAAGRDVARQNWMICEAIASYYIFLNGCKHEARFTEALVEASKEMDTKPFFRRLGAIVAKTRPIQ